MSALGFLEYLGGQLPGLILCVVIAVATTALYAAMQNKP